MNIRKTLYCVLLSAAIICIAACSGRKTFEIDGQLLNMDQGTIYVYSNDGLLLNIDTIKIQGGRFEYSRAIERKGTLVLVFPNFSEVPVFAEPGEDVTLKGNAQQLNKLTVNGTDDNKLMTKFRMSCFEKSPVEEKKNAEKVIQDNPESQVSNWLLYRYFIKAVTPDYKKALQLAKQIRKKQPENGNLAGLIENLETICKGKTSGKLQFTATDVNGKTVSTETLKGKKAIIYVGATWDYNNEIDRNVKQYVNNTEYDFTAVRISLDASKKEEATRLQYNNYDGKMIIVCQEKLYKSPIMKTLGLSGIGDNIIIDAQGNIKKRNVMPSEIEKEMK